MPQRTVSVLLLEVSVLLTGLLMTAGAFVVSAIVTGLVRRRALRLGHLEAVTGRSSHEVPTPSSGGLGIAAGGTLAGLAIAALLETVAIPVLLAGAIIAIVGWWDDRTSIAARWRLAVQILLMGLVVSTLPLGMLPPVLGYQVPESVAAVLLVLAGAFWINIFNFMDGIDGLAASESIFLLLSGALMALILSPQAMAHPLFWWIVAVAGATVGFLLFNWPPAKIFMGDAGSTYLGLMLAFFGLAALLIGWLTLPQLCILPALFITDALTTMLRRLLRGERVHEAHRLHAYQQMAGRLGAHRPVTLGYMAINIAGLLPLAIIAGALEGQAWAVVAALYAALVPVALWLGAGVPSDPQADKKGTQPDNGE